MNKIIFIGRSVKFIDIFLNKFHNKSYYVIPWRQINNFIDHDYDQIRNPKIIVICGYDYSSSYSNYENYIESTVNRPIKLIKKINSVNTKIIYINTDYKNTILVEENYKYIKNVVGKNILDNFINTVSIILNKKDNIYDYDSEVKKGGAIIFDETGIHRGSKTSKNDRIALRFFYKKND